MKTTIAFFIILLSIITIKAQADIDLLTYENTQDINFFASVKNGALIKEYITATKNSVKVGDTLIIGSPTSQEMMRLYSFICNVLAFRVIITHDQLIVDCYSLS